MESTSSQQTPQVSPQVSTQTVTQTRLVTLFLLLFIAYIAWSQYQSFGQKKEIETLQTAYDTYVQELNTLKASSTDANESVRELYTTLSYVIEEEKNKNQSLAEKLGVVSSTVGSLDKLSKIDSQLLKKYSKVYFLNENYAPTSLASIPVEYTFDIKVTYQIHADAIFFLQNLLDDARRDGLQPLIISAYRSFATQASVKALNKIKYGAKTANQFSAEQGFSEHQLGTTVDITTPQTGVSFVKFDTTKEYVWLQEHAHIYGFALSYPKGNTYYAYEPWHWRFVGVELATKLHDEGKYFYNYDQRTMDLYLPKIFDR
jgi:zinc D-Ala-D-Ala carboxypeptidase